MQKDAHFILSTIHSNLIEGYGYGTTALNAWGAHDFKASEASDRHGLSWLQFKVSASKHTGWVRVALRGIDIPTDSGVYTITLEKFNNTSAEYGVIASQHGVKESELASTIDKMVEQ